MKHGAPLPVGFLLASIIGFFVSILSIWQVSVEWGFALAVFFAILFIASMISISYSEVDRVLARETAIIRQAHAGRRTVVKSIKIPRKKKKKKGGKRK